MSTSHTTVSTCFSTRCPGVEPEHLHKETIVSLRNLYAHYLQVLCQEQIYSYAPHTQPHAPDSNPPPQVLKVRIKSFELSGILFSSVRFNKNSKQNNYAADFITVHSFQNHPNVFSLSQQRKTSICGWFFTLKLYLRIIKLT
jgi:hypothetical protein